MKINTPPANAAAAQFGQLSPDQARSIDEICDYFEHQLYTQGRTTIEELLGTVDEPQRPVLLGELLYLEFEAYLARDASPDRDKYLLRFSGHEAVVQDVFDAVFPTAPGHRAAPSVAGQAAAEDVWPSIANYRILRKLNQGGMGARL